MKDLDKINEKGGLTGCSFFVDAKKRHKACVPNRPTELRPKVNSPKETIDATNISC